MKTNITKSTTWRLDEIIRKLDNVEGGTTTTSGGGTGDASAAKQDTTNSTLSNILAELKDDFGLVENQVTDSNNVVHIRRTITNGDTGVITTTYLNPQSGATTTPTFPLKSRARISLTASKYNTVVLPNVTTAGSIPTNSVAYSIVNLGNTPFTFKGASIPTQIGSVEDDVTAIENATFNAMTYDPNGNTLFITYTIKL